MIATKPKRVHIRAKKYRRKMAENEELLTHDQSFDLFGDLSLQVKILSFLVMRPPQQP